MNAVFWFFEAPNGPLGLILVPFGWIWSQTWVPNGLKSLVKSDQKVGSLFDQKNDHFRVPKRVPETSKIEIAGLRHFLPAIRFCLLFFFSFSLGFGALWVPLGSLLGLLAVLLGGLWTQKC